MLYKTHKKVKKLFMYQMKVLIDRKPRIKNLEIPLKFSNNQVSNNDT